MNSVRGNGSTGTWRLTSSDALQGARGVAVLVVFAFHLGAIRGGWLGVEFFFVLSGFLIASLTFPQVREGRFNMRLFLRKRFFRLAPALLLCAVGTMVVALVLQRDVEESFVGFVSSLVQVANLVEGQNIEVGAFGHTWSLSIEGQFYLLLPLLLVLWTRRSEPERPDLKKALWFCWGLVALLVTVRTGMVLFGLPGWFEIAYYGTLARFPAILIGVGLALHLLTKSPRADTGVQRPVLAFGVSFALLVAMVVAPIQSPAVWGMGVTAFDLAAAWLISELVLFPRSWVAQVLSVRLLAWVGEISYGLYLFHMPVLYFSLLIDDVVLRTVVQLILPFLIAVLSYYLVERRVTRRFSPRPAVRSQVLTQQES